MKGNDVFKIAVKRMGEAALEALKLDGREPISTPDLLIVQINGLDKSFRCFRCLSPDKMITWKNNLK
jgi:hypothetical protein